MTGRRHERRPDRQPSFKARQLPPTGPSATRPRPWSSSRATSGSRPEGFQPVEAYDVVIANLDPTLRREPPPETPEPLLGRFSLGTTTQEVAACLAQGNEPPDRQAAESALLELVADGKAQRSPLGDDALWTRA